MTVPQPGETGRHRDNILFVLEAPAAAGVVLGGLMEQRGSLRDLETKEKKEAGL